MDAGGGLGTFGPSTERAVIDFQIRHGIGRDGVVGPGTFDKLRIQ
jgi:peptidoglycan hydrolase-like protein with peptidoglycan-binding domain